MDIGTRIRMRREELNMSQDELAKRVGYKSRSSINKIEIDGRGLPQKKIISFANALETTPAHLMGWDTDQLRTSGQASLFDEIPITTTLSYGEHELITSFRNHTSDEQNDFIKICNKYDSLTEQGKIMFFSFLNSMDSVPGMIKPFSVDSSQLQVPSKDSDTDLIGFLEKLGKR